MRGFNPFQWFAREVDAAEPGILDAPQLEDTTPIPSPSELLATDGEQVASLLRQLDAANSTVAQLQEQLLKPPPKTGWHGCPNCAGLRETVRLLREERGELRGRLARHELAAAREQQLP